jgi:hypothetical protein
LQSPFRRGLVCFLLATGGAGCAADAPLPPPPPEPEDAAFDLYLIGDAGWPDPAGEPMFIALSRVIERRGPDRALVAFLGDNIYPYGMPAHPEGARREAERILRAQLDVPVGTGARGIFVAGNHGWDHSGPEGWERIVLQQEFVDANGEGRVEFLPGGGCPGPAVRDVAGLRLIALDTQWWLHPYDKPRPPDSPCPAATDDEVAALIRAALRDAGSRHVVILAHHPLASGGAHGILPVLPIRFAPVPRFSAQDLGHPRYRHMRDVLVDAFAEHPPLIYAAGHDHNLQLLRGGGARYTIVSGTGYFRRPGRVRRLPHTVYGRRENGFFRVSVQGDGQVRVVAYLVDASGAATEDFATILQMDG